MIPVLACPILNRPDLLDRMLASVDEPTGLRLVIDNGGVVGDVDAYVVRLPANLGVAASWNLALKLTPDAAWWFLVNADVAFAPGDLARLCVLMADPSPKVVNLTNDGFAAFALNRACLDAVGYFDENFHPAYCEDADYEYRCKLKGVPIMRLTSDTVHDHSATIREPRYGRANNRTYPENVAYFRRKWGGPLRGGETFDSPFNDGSPAECWHADPARRREQSWETTALEPAGDEVR